MEAIAQLNNQRGSARKARLVLDLIRGKNVVEAQKILTFSRKRVAQSISKLLNSAIANATVKEGKAEFDKMIVKTAFADQGPAMKRFRPRAQGRAFIIRKQTCHIYIAVADKE